MLYRYVRVTDTEGRSAMFAVFVGRHIDEAACGAFGIAHLVLGLTLHLVEARCHGYRRKFGVHRAKWESE